MIKYISDLIQLLKSRIAGMNANADKWTNQPVAKADLEDYVKQLETDQDEIDKAAAVLQQKREASRQLVENLTRKLKQVDNLAMGIHAEEAVKLGEYGITLRKEKSSRSVPGKAIISSITDDADGEGFVISLTKLNEAEHYEIEKGVATDNSSLVLAPPYPFLKTTTKLTFVDDDIIKGKRYFYRARGINATGPGEWSEPVSRVQ